LHLRHHQVNCGSRINFHASMGGFGEDCILCNTRIRLSRDSANREM
jgi:hypothetical protein